MDNNHFACTAESASASDARMVTKTATTDSPADIRERTANMTVPGIDYGLLPELTGFSVKLTWVLAHSLVARDMDDGVTPLRFAMLEVVGRNPGLQQMQLAEALTLTRPGTTLLLDFWQDRGCIERRKLAEDRRSFGVYATEKGMEELARMRTNIKRADEELTSRLTEAEREEFRRLMRKIHQ